MKINVKINNQSIQIVKLMMKNVKMMIFKLEEATGDLRNFELVTAEECDGWATSVSQSPLKVPIETFQSFELY